ncbi:MAG: alpha/beta fold hydrolase [Acidobacteria bacterium]|nr:alpha/beta fold hydrolase [Acidobacteriota bacterium]
MNHLIRSFCVAVLFAAFAGAVQAQQPATTFTPPETIDYRKANVMSEGVRLNAELFSLKSLAGKPLPTIIMAHGWGGTAAGFRRDAIDLANAGYLVIVFDYRGWGESDSRVILTGAAPVKPAQYRKGQKFTAEVTEVREVVDPFEQTTDWFNVIDWAMGEPMVDKNRIGIRGSSYSGGHVLYVAAYEPRVKAFVSQVGAFDSRPKSISLAGAASDQIKLAHDESTKRARGEIGYPEAGQRVIGQLYGAPIRDKLLRWAPVEVADKRTDCAMLFIVAEKEELFDNKDHAKAAYDRARGPKKYVEIPKITHYGIYRESREQAVKLAVEWFDQYLKK